MSESDSGIEASPNVVQNSTNPIIKAKKPKTEAQQAAWEKALATRGANRLKRAEEKETLFKEKLAKQETKIAKRDKKIENKVKKQITEKLLQSDDEDEEEEVIEKPMPKVVKKSRSYKSKVVYVDSDDEEIESKAPIVIINKFDKKEKEPVKAPELPAKPKIRFL